MLSVIRGFLEHHGIGPCRILAAVSGGADSVALFLGLMELRDAGFEVLVAHVNHHLRGDESDADEAFVRELARRESVPCIVLDGTLGADDVRRSGVEGAARDVRYRLLQECRAANEAEWIATAHQQNDQAETILMRLLTGSGIAGLRGIHPVRNDRVIRPLLGVRRSDIESFLAARRIVPRTDSTNAEARFLRNRVRQALALLDPASVAALASVSSEASSLVRVIERVLDDEDRLHVIELEDETTFRSMPEDPWLRRALLHRHIRRLSSSHREISSSDLERLDGELAAHRRVTVSPELELVERRGAMVLRRPARDAAPYEIAIAEGDTVTLPGGASLTLRRSAGDGAVVSPDGMTQRFQVASGRDCVFAVRNRRPGDRLRPLGAPGAKKLKDLLIDRKIDASERDSLPLLTADGEIVWVAGVALSENFRVTGDDSGDVYEVECERRHPCPEGSRALQR